MFLSLEEFEDVKYGSDEWEVVEEGEWVVDGKWEHQTSIVKNKTTDKYYNYGLSRSGSYYSDYYYVHQEDDKGVELSEVKQVEKVVTIKEWVYV